MKQHRDAYSFEQSEFSEENLQEELDEMSRRELMEVCWELDVEFDFSNSAEELRQLVAGEVGETKEEEQSKLVARLAVALGEADGMFTTEEVEEAYQAAELQIEGLDGTTRSRLKQCVGIVREESIDSKRVAEQLGANLDSDEIEALMDFLFDIAVADGVFDPREEKFLRVIQSIVGADKEKFERQVRLCRTAAGKKDRVESEEKPSSATVSEIIDRDVEKNTGVEAAGIAIDLVYERERTAAQVSAAICSLSPKIARAWERLGGATTKREVVERFVEVCSTRGYNPERVGSEIEKRFGGREAETTNTEESDDEQHSSGAHPEEGDVKSQLRAVCENEVREADKVLEDYGGLKSEWFWGALGALDDGARLQKFVRKRGGAFTLAEVTDRVVDICSEFGYKPATLLGDIVEEVIEFRSDEGRGAQSHDDPERHTDSGSSKNLSNVEDARRALNQLFDKLGASHKEIYWTIVALEGQTSEIVRWLRNGNGFYSRSQAVDRMGEIVDRFDKEGRHFVEKIEEKLQEDNEDQKWSVEKEQIQTIAVDECGEVQRNLLDRVNLRELARNADGEGEFRTKVTAAVAALDRRKEKRRTGRPRYEKSDSDSGDSTATAARNETESQRSTEKSESECRDKKEAAGEETKSETIRDFVPGDSVLLLEPSKTVHRTLRRMGVKTIEELLEWDVESSRLSRRGKKAQKIMELREQAKQNMTRGEQKRDNSEASRNVDALYTLLKQNQ